MNNQDLSQLGVGESRRYGMYDPSATPVNLARVF